MHFKLQIMRLTLILVCTFSMLFPTSSIMERVASISIQAASGIVAKQAAATIAATGLSTLATPASISAAAGGVIGISAGVLSVGVGIACAIKSINASSNYYKDFVKGQAYRYDDTEAIFRNKTQTAKRITCIEKYSSPIVDTYFNHHEIFFQMDNLLWGFVSLVKEGLENGVALEKDAFVARRANNMLVQSKKVNVPAQQLINFLKENEGQSYNLLFWNCQHFSNALWKEINDYAAYTATNPEFLQKDWTASRINQIEEYAEPKIFAFEIDRSSWELISFEISGLFTKISTRKDQLIALMHERIPFESRSFQTFASNALNFHQVLWEAVII